MTHTKVVRYWQQELEYILIQCNNNAIKVHYIICTKLTDLLQVELLGYKFPSFFFSTDRTRWATVGSVEPGSPSITQNYWTSASWCRTSVWHCSVKSDGCLFHHCTQNFWTPEALSRRSDCWDCSEQNCSVPEMLWLWAKSWDLPELQLPASSRS